ncbi:MAG: ABC transporter substrate-binding protein [Chloroflexi bacterium]|nr:ABC transporter substrate-binding protein [Chloroflexota bacterium]
MTLVGAACGGGGAAAPTATRAPAAPTATLAPSAAATLAPAKPKPQGRAVVAVGDLGGHTVDYHHFISGNQLAISRAITDGLAFADNGCTCFSPDLAQSWKSSEDGLTWDITLRKGVKAHDGSELTSDDVVFSINRIMDPAVGHVYQGRFALTLGKVLAVEPQLVRFQMKGPWPAFQYDLDRHMFIMPKKYFETVGIDEFKKKPIGYGPFKLTANVIGERVEFEAFEDHFMRVPTIKNLTIRLMPEVTTRVAALKTGEVDVTAVSGAALTDVQQTPNLRLVLTNQTSGVDLQFNMAYTTEQTPFNDVKVRKAVALSLDRQGYVKVIYNDLARVPPVATFMDYTFGTDKTLQPYPYDTEQAKKLLAEAGFPNGFSTQLFTTVSGATLAQAIASGLSKVSLKVEVVPVEDSQYAAQMRGKSGLKPGLYIQSYPAYFDVSVAVDGMYRFGSGFGLIKDSEIDDLQAKQALEGNAAKREALLKQMVRRVYDNYYKIGLAFVDSAIAVGPRVKDWRTRPFEGTAANFEILRLN